MFLSKLQINLILLVGLLSSAKLGPGHQGDFVLVFV